MKWPGELVEASLIKRYKRFLADFRLNNGDIVTGHCANTGSMVTCLEDNAPCWITYHNDPKRKLAWSWQAIRMPDGWVGINTSIANRLVGEAIENGIIAELQGYETRKAEQRYGQKSRIDFLLTDSQKPPCYVEVKNVTLLLKDGVAAFPDAITQRGSKHLQELAGMVEAGSRAVLIYCVQRESAQEVVPARDHDPEYARILGEVVAKGVEVYAYRAEFSNQSLSLRNRLPVVL